MHCIVHVTPAYNTFMEDAIAYLRVSTSKQEANYSKPQQLKGCRAYASELNHTLIAIFDDTISGTTVERPGLLQMRAFLLKRKSEGKPVKHIYVYHTDRWARDLLPQLILDAEFKKLGCTMYYVVGRFTPDDDGEMMKQFSGIMSGRERKAILRRTMMGKIGKAEKGYVIISGSAPYGYEYVSEAHKGSLRILEKEKDVVLLIVKWYLYGLDEDEVRLKYKPHHPLSMRAVAVMLHEMRIPTRADTDGNNGHKAGFSEWRVSIIARILKCRTYMGEWTFGKTSTTIQSPVSVPVPAIISPEVFALIDKQIKGNVHFNPRNVGNKYLLRGRIQCECGKSMCGRTLRRRVSYTYYVCGSQVLLGTIEGRCKSTMSTASWIEEQVRITIVAMLNNIESLIDGFITLNKRDRAKNDQYIKTIAAYDKRIAQLDAQSDRLLDQVIAGVFTETQVARKNKELVEERDKEVLKRDAEQLNIHKVVDDKVLQNFERTCKDIKAGISDATFDDWQRYLSLLDLRVVVNVNKTFRISISINEVRADIDLTGKVVI